MKHFEKWSTLMLDRWLPYGHQLIDESDVQAVVRALRNDRITQGPLVEEFEERLAEFCGARFAVAVSNGTAALHLAALALGVGPGDEVITSPNTFIASANCVRYCGADVRFADIDSTTLNIDAHAFESVLEDPRRRSGIKGVIPVDFAGNPAGLETIWNIAQRWGLFVLEDACHSLGSRYRDASGQWHRVGDCAHADAAVLSFHPVKLVTTGEGGAILTNREDVAERYRTLRHHGILRRQVEGPSDEGAWYHEMHSLGFNYRLTDIQCALGLSQLDKLDSFTQRRRAIAGRYDAAFASMPNVDVPFRSPDVEHVYHLYVIQVDSREEVFEYLHSRGVGVQVHYIPVHTQPYYRGLYGLGWGDFPVAEAYYRRALSLPMYPALTDVDVDRVIAEVREAVGAVAKDGPG